MTNTPLSSAELAAKLGRSVVTLERWRRLRKGPPFYRVMGRVVYDPTDVDAWLEAQKQATGRDGAA
jgi:hypothetical protein